MGKWFGRSEPERRVDEDLGQLVLERGTWVGNVEIAEANAGVQILVEDADGEPLASAAQRLREFRRRYAELRPELAVEFRRLLKPWHREFASGEVLETGDDLLERFELWGLEIGEADLIAAFSLKEGWDDGMFRVSYSGWRPRGLGVDD